MEYDYDLFVIGAGSGGVRAARTSAATGAKVGIAEQQYLGGTCVNVGCVPKKLFVYASHFHEAFEDAKGFGWQVPAIDFDWQTSPIIFPRRPCSLSSISIPYQKLCMQY